jgi:hypothetical protein
LLDGKTPDGFYFDPLQKAAFFIFWYNASSTLSNFILVIH